MIGGFGYLSSSVNISIKLAWESFGERNGVTSLQAMVDVISKYRKQQLSQHSLVGCRVIVDPIFFSEEDYIEVPSSWSNSIVSGKTYDAFDPDIENLLHQISLRTGQRKTPRLKTGSSTEFADEGEEFLGPNKPKFGDPSLVSRRLGQGAFRVKIIEIYGGKCAVTGTSVLETLDAAHISPYGADGNHDTTNGLLLRKDIHALFDAGLMWIDSDYTVQFHGSVFELNLGNTYKQYHKRKLNLPRQDRHWPDLVLLEKHMRDSIPID